MTDYRTQAEKDAAERFKNDTANHEMNVLHDDGLYRHLRFKAPEHGFYWFDIVTWPGSLAIRGDMDGYMFTRLTDMFEFFRGKGINPGYWAEKLEGGRDSAMSYDQDSFERQVKQYVAEAIREGDAPRGIGAEVTRDIFEWGDITHEAGARKELVDFKFGDWTFGETWEWNFRSYDWSFLWICHAIVWGIDQYDAAKATPKQVAS